MSTCHLKSRYRAMSHAGPLGPKRTHSGGQDPWREWGNMQDGGISGCILKALNAQEPKGDFQNLIELPSQNAHARVWGSTPGFCVFYCKKNKWI